MVKLPKESLHDLSDDDASVLIPGPSLEPVPGGPSVPVMTGTHFHALDEKGRIIIPAKLRPALTEQFWMMLDENDNVGIYNFQTGLDVLEHCERMIADHPGDQDIADAVERITGATDLVTVEGGWRVPVPEVLRFYAGLDKEVVTVGVLNHAVLWDRSKWEESHQRRLQSPEVRKAQAEMLRSAASGLKRSQERQAEAPPVESDAATDARIARSGVAPAPVARTAASSGDGRRSARVLSLSELGR